jgi:hypothetical protein
MRPTHPSLPCLPALAVLVALSLPLLGGCDDTALEPTPDPVTFDLDFTSETHGWEAGFSDFRPEDEEQMDLASGHEPLPPGVEREGMGLFVGATNRSDDVFMFWTGQVGGLAPGGIYDARFLVEFATEAPAGCAGVGGAPGESVHLKAGATPIRPQPLEENGYLQMNIDKGNQFAGGEDAIRIGDVAGTHEDCLDWEWEMKTVESDEPFEARADEGGVLWVLVGTDSGFEARTELYYTRVRVELDPR